MKAEYDLSMMKSRKNPYVSKWLTEINSGEILLEDFMTQMGITARQLVAKPAGGIRYANVEPDA